MKSTLLLIAFIIASIFQGISQIPQKISFQAVLRNSDGSLISSQAVVVKISLRKIAADGVVVYTETFNETTSAQGVVSIAIGGGDATSFAAVPWSENIFIQTEAKKASEASFHDFGTTPILSVPYALTAGNIKEVKSLPGANVDDPIFVVRNSDGKIVFAVYQNAVRINIDDNGPTKGARGGFAIGGLSQTKGSSNPDYMTITADSARFYFKNPTVTKGARGGFAVGGLSQSKGGIQEYFKVTSDTSYFKTTLFTESNIVSTGTVSTGIGISSSALSDNEGNVYKTVKIGEQTWMKENLKATKYNDGTPLSTLNEVAVYDLKPDVGDTAKNYGRLYAYEVVTSGKNVCPTGWHVPSVDDWLKLLTFVGGGDWQNNRVITGLKLSEKGTVAEGSGFWDVQKSVADNSSGFSARPGGQAYYSASWSSFMGLGQMANWWGIVDPTTAKVYSIDGYNFGLNDSGESYPGTAYSIRCVKD